MFLPVTFVLKYFLGGLKMKTFYKRLKQLRLDRKKNDEKYTQSYMANVIGVARSTYTAYENGTKQPPMDTILKMADHFGVSTDYLTGKSDEALAVKDKKDIAKRMERIKKDLCENEGLSFYGEPISDEAKESLIAALEYIVMDAQKKNKKYIPTKYRK